MTERHDAPPAVRAELLAAEHWSLLATRNAAQSELLSRITARSLFMPITWPRSSTLALPTRVRGHRSSHRPLLATSIHDDAEGIWQTYNHLAPRGHVSSLLASSGSFITFVTSGLAAVFSALAAAALASPSWLVGAAAGAAAVVYLVGSLVLGVRKFQGITRAVEFPRPAVAG